MYRMIFTFVDIKQTHKQFFYPDSMMGGIKNKTLLDKLSKLGQLTKAKTSSSAHYR